MQIKSLHIKNFRCFNDLHIDFDDRLTVLVGENGAGKTAVLDALGAFLKRAGNPLTRTFNILDISETDIAIGRKIDDLAYKITICDKASINTDEFDVIYNALPHKNMHCINMDTLLQIGNLFDNNNIVTVAYMAGRFINEGDSINNNIANATSEYPAFVNNFNRTIDFASTITWFDKADADEARAMRDGGTKEELPELASVRKALSMALLGRYEKPRMIGNPPELMIYQKDTNQAFKVSQLSDGYRAMLALVMDLARRMAQAGANNVKNGLDESLLETPAIVLIDEVELHLHPSWQQTVLTTLMEIFPNTQFIVSTHSPQILTSIPHKHIRIMSDGKAYSYDEQTQGVEASRLLKRVFGVDPRPVNLTIVKDLAEYRDLVYTEKWDSPRAIELKQKLYEHFGSDDIDLMDLELHIDNSKWEKGL
jgi:predicted ATP-binding protein involved in virulence